MYLPSGVTRAQWQCGRSWRGLFGPVGSSEMIPLSVSFLNVPSALRSTQPAVPRPYSAKTSFFSSGESERWQGAGCPVASFSRSTGAQPDGSSAYTATPPFGPFGTERSARDV